MILATPRTHKTPRRRPAPRRLRGLGDIGPGPGQCGLTNTPGWCTLPGSPDLVPCNQIRECDQYTGAAHFEYALPGGSPNADIAIYNPDTGTFTYNNAQAQSTPTVPYKIAYDPTRAAAVNLSTAPNYPTIQSATSGFTVAKPAATTTSANPTPNAPAPTTTGNPSAGGSSAAETTENGPTDFGATGFHLPDLNLASIAGFIGAHKVALGVAAAAVAVYVIANRKGGRR